MDSTWKAGLEDVVAARSAITAIDGAAGRLYHRGYEIGELAEHASFEETTHSLVRGATVGGRERRLRGRGCAPPGAPAAGPRPPAHAAGGHAPPRRLAHRRLAGRHCRSRPSRSTDSEANLRKALRLMTLVPGSRRRLATPADGARAGAGRHRGLARRPLPPPPARAPTRARRRAGPRHDPHAPRGPRAQCLDVRGPGRGRHAGGPPRGGGRRDRHAQGAAPRRRQRGRAGHAAGDRRSGAGRGATSRPGWTRTRAAPGPSGRTRGPGSPASATACTGWTTRGRACCGRWRRRWPRRPGTPGSSRSPRASTRR